MNLSTEASNKLRIYQEHFESSYIEAAHEFYSSHAPAYLDENGVQNFMKYVRCVVVDIFLLSFQPVCNAMQCSFQKEGQKWKNSI